jgi:hypothetical protein
MQDETKPDAEAEIPDPEVTEAREPAYFEPTPEDAARIAAARLAAIEPSEGGGSRLELATRLLCAWTVGNAFAADEVLIRHAALTIEQLATVLAEVQKEAASP